MSLASFNSNRLLASNQANNKCPICLEDILNITYSIDCLHSFCFGCINEWVKEHNKCPMCRQIIQFICFNIRSDTDYDMVEILPPVVHRDNVFRLSDELSFVLSPDETGIFIVFPRRIQNHLFFMMKFLEPGQSHIVRSVAGALYVLPIDLQRVLQRLESAGIYQYYPHLDKHPPYIKDHKHH